MPDPAVLLDDPDILYAQPTLAWHDAAPVRHHGGIAVLPWRGDALACGDACAWVADVDELGSELWSQAVVRARKQRQACLQDCAQAWRRLEAGGRLVVVGGNDVGIKSTVRQLHTLLGAPLLELSRAHARVGVWLRHTGDMNLETQRGQVPLCHADQAPLLDTCPSAFSWKHLDCGTQLLQAAMAGLSDAPTLIADFGAGVGHLGLLALQLWPNARLQALEADAQALSCLRTNAQKLDLAQRCQAFWWDAAEVPPASDYDLVLCNPPCHEALHTSQGYVVAQRMIRQAAACMRPDGKLLLVANRQLPYEAALQAAFAHVEQARQEQGFKVLMACQPRKASIL